MKWALWPCRHYGAALAAPAVVCLALSACDPVPETPAAALAPAPIAFTAGNAVLSAQTESLTPDELRLVSDPSVDGAYTLGPDDMIATNIYLHPELDVPTSGETGGALITSDGTVELPLIGSIQLGGMTLAQAGAALTAAYGFYLTNPKIAVELEQAQSLRYYLLGAFTAPGVKYPLHQLTLLEALALGGSVDISGADLYQAYVAQGQVKLPVDLYALLLQGDLSQNIPLASGDAIVIPPSTSEEAFVFGAVGKPGPIQFEPGGLSLLQALASAGLDLAGYTSARLSRVHIIRAHGQSAQFYVVDAAMILNGRAASFALDPGDIVFVPPTAVATWNEVLSELLPSLQVISGVLNPFVSIKYLQQRNN